MNFISDTLYWISTGLLVPVIILLIVLFIRSLLLVGSFFGQYVSIRKTATILKTELRHLNSANVDTLLEKLPQNSNSLAII
ncbi:MAG: MotA/TolQ/ExbB proton channel family protein, partial [Bacteroides sp.]|nr:MotA/TolQ/ExbB proton channel family protein [Bacteroides sp.]